MMKRLWVMGAFLLLFSTCAWGVTDEEVSAALTLFPEGQDVAVTWTDEGRVQLESAIGVLESALGVTALFDHSDEDAYMALEIDPEKKTWVNALSQAYYTWGDVFLTDDGAKKTAFVRGQYWGLKSLRMNAQFAQIEYDSKSFITAVEQATDIAALFWTYGNWSRKDEFDAVGAVFRNDPPKLEALIDRVFELDPTFQDNAPYRALAAFWGGLPPMPLYAYGQNLPRALSYICPVLNESDYCENCENCPISDEVDAYFENRLIFAQYYLMEKSLWDDAARVLQTILEDPIGERFPLYNAFDQAQARTLLDEVERHL